MSILSYLLENSKEYAPPSVRWREKRVWHKTPLGNSNFVKIKSLPPEEQLKYKPADLVKKDKRASKFKQGISSKKTIHNLNVVPPNQQVLPTEPKAAIEGELFDFYYGVKDVSKYDLFEEKVLIKATLNSVNAVDLEDEGLHIVYARNVPIDAVKEYMDENGDWKIIDIEDKDKKAEFIKFSDNDFFKLDLYSYKDIVELELQSDEPKEEPVKEYINYLKDKSKQTLKENTIIETKKQDMISQHIEFNWFLDQKLSLFESLGGCTNAKL